MLLRTSRFELEVHCARWMNAGSLYVRIGRREYWHEWGALRAA